MKIKVKVTRTDGTEADVTVGSKDLMLAEGKGASFEKSPLQALWMGTHMAMLRCGMTSAKGFDAWLSEVDDVEDVEADDEPNPTK